MRGLFIAFLVSDAGLLPAPRGFVRTSKVTTKKTAKAA